MRGLGVASTLLTISMMAGAQVTSAPFSHNTGADAARVAGPGMSRSFFNNRRIFNGRGEHRRFGHAGQNFALVPFYGYPYIGGPYFDDDYESSDRSQGQAPIPSVVVVPQASSPASPEVSDLSRQIDRLSPELNALHDRQEAAAPEAEARVPEQPATLLVFHDQHVEQIHNYAIVGQTLWAFDTGTGVMGRKVPLSELDLAETAHVNAEHGVRFSTPAAAAR